MRYDEFLMGLTNLEKAYGKTLEKNQCSYWFDKFKSWTGKKFLSTIDDHINQNERFPSIATLLKKGADFREEVLSHRSECNFCSGSGTVTAKKDGYATCFRCPSCHNWAGRYSTEIPLYSSVFFEDGYVLETFCPIETAAWKELLKRTFLTRPDPEKERLREQSLRRDRARGNSDDDDPFGGSS